MKPTRFYNGYKSAQKSAQKCWHYGLSIFPFKMFWQFLHAVYQSTWTYMKSSRIRYSKI